jgi:hypothetical protein
MSKSVERIHLNGQEAVPPPLPVNFMKVDLSHSPKNANPKGCWCQEKNISKQDQAIWRNSSLKTLRMASSIGLVGFFVCLLSRQNSGPRIHLTGFQ